MLKRIYLEITNACNLNCPFCTNTKGNDYLNLNLIDSYTNQIKPYCNYLYLHIIGEPLLHPEFNKILDLLDKKNFDVQLVTNGTLLYKYKDILKHSCIRKLSISIHSINNMNFNNKYFETINNLIEINKNSKLELRFYDYDNLSLDLKSYLDYLKETYNFEITKKINSYKLKENTYIYFSDLFNWPNINDPYISNVGTCKGAIDMLAINSKSEVTLCCLDPYGYNSLGNLKETTFKEIIESEKYINICNEIKNSKINQELCQKCTYRLRFKV